MFSDSSLDGGLFDIPAGFAQLQEDAMQVLAGDERNNSSPRRENNLAR
jgi:hypothetical protein